MNAESEDQQQIRLLAIFHYVVGGITSLASCFALIHLVIGVMMVASPESFGPEPAQQAPALFGWLFAVIGGGIFLFGQAMAIGMIIAGRSLQRRVRYQFAFVMACIECIVMPFGTVLGVFTIIVLSRASVKQLFAAPPP